MFHFGSFRRADRTDRLSLSRIILIRMWSNFIVAFRVDEETLVQTASMSVDRGEKWSWLKTMGDKMCWKRSLQETLIKYENFKKTSAVMPATRNVL